MEDPSSRLWGLKGFHVPCISETIIPVGLSNVTQITEYIKHKNET